ncbi:hypothetical protein C8J56DRAFT_794833 [Mycena floridula]|nr:hypothetical protein C8J56DRAFT_794833 [Mycena floridula]
MLWRNLLLWIYAPSCHSLLQQLTIDDVLSFIRLTAGLKNDILFGQKPSHNPETIPQELPQNVLSFLSSTMDLSLDHLNCLWATFGVTIWTENHCPKEQAAQDRARFHENAESELMHFCIHADCPSKTRLLRVKSGSSQRRKTVLFTLADGAGPHIMSNYLIRSDCNTSYHHNFYVQNKVRVYYDGVPKVIEITKHHYAETGVLNLFIAQILNAWTSALNAATIYNTVLAKPQFQPQDWGNFNFDFEFRTEHIWEGIIMLCLLEDYAGRKMILSVPLYLPVLMTAQYNWQIHRPAALDITSTDSDKPKEKSHSDQFGTYSLC